MKILRVHDESRPAWTATGQEAETVLGRELEAKTQELAIALDESRKSRCFLTRVLEFMSTGLWVFDDTGRVELVNPAALSLAGPAPEGVEERRGAQIFPDLEMDRLDCSSPPIRRESRLVRVDGSSIPVLLSVAVACSGPCARKQIIVNCADITDQKEMESRLQNAHKLEAVGQLAAGVAHEVNTPIQFIGDSVRFLQDCLRDLAKATAGDAALFDDLRTRGVLTSADEQRLADLRADSDLDFALAEAPAATERTLRGVTRVAEIVRALRAFAHPDQDTIAEADVNVAVRDAAVVARVECKRVAELVIELGALPLVECNINELNQVFLNLIVNASHAIEERGEGPGKITIRSTASEDFVEVTVNDDGAGIPDDVQPRIFEPFFTTKVLGKGTGQGLALAHTFIETHHQGRLTFVTEAGVGTTFTVRLPLRRSSSSGRQA